jgi:hypothetical protein
VANSSGIPVLVDRVKEGLIVELKNNNIDAISAPTVTMLAKQLDLSSPNRGAFRALKCDYMMLTEIARAENNPVVEFALFQKGRNSAVLRDSLPASSEQESTDSVLAVLPAISVRIRDRVTSRKITTR